MVSAGGDHDAAAAAWLMPTVRSGCRGTAIECLENEDEEFELDSKLKRRILDTRHYISYGALQGTVSPTGAPKFLKLSIEED
ncbi:hypothetical protein DH2020_042533 [Rehmannia glutinosa]|uniref:Uncharacterized protein n=1 Tax=Rehmannia glutinosa TaxID=99300 RepID=A0ABR0UN47_REHGL